MSFSLSLRCLSRSALFIPQERPTGRFAALGAECVRVHAAIFTPPNVATPKVYKNLFLFIIEFSAN